MQWNATARTDRGRVRSGNEDALLARCDLGIFAVADGLGGHASGEVASAMAIEVVEAGLAAALTAPSAPADLDAALRSAVLDAHHTIADRAEREADKAGMGTTLTLAAAVPGGLGALRIAHVGDSRAYRLHRGELAQLTTDHTLVRSLIEQGAASPAEARTHPYAHILTRALGITPEDIDVDLVGTTLEPGDLLVLCSDGLTGMLDDEDLRALLDRDLPLETLADQLIEAANLRGGLDNITAVLVRREA